MRGKPNQGLKGMYFFHSGMEYIQTGRVIEHFPDGLLLLQQDDRDDPLRPLYIVAVDDIVRQYDVQGAPVCNDTWEFFSTEKDYLAYVKYFTFDPERDGKKLDTRPKVVSINNKLDPKPL